MENNIEKMSLKKGFIRKEFFLLSMIYAFWYAFYIETINLPASIKNMLTFFVIFLLVVNFIFVVRKEGRNIIKYLMYSFFLILLAILSYILFSS